MVLDNFQKSSVIPSPATESVATQAREYVSQFELTRDYLERCHELNFSTTAQISQRVNEQFPSWYLEMMSLWDEIGSIVLKNLDVFDAIPGNELELFRERFFSADRVLAKLAMIRRRFSHCLDYEQVRVLDDFAISTNFRRDEAKAMLAIHQADRAARLTSKLQGYLTGLILHSPALIHTLKYTLLYKNEEFSQDSLAIFTYVVDKAINIVNGVSPKSKSYSELSYYLSQIKLVHLSTLSDIERLISCEQPVGLLTDEINGEQIVVNPDLAEGKAIRRIRVPIADDDWEVSHRPGDKIDIQEIRERLKRCLSC
jgi:hypothetical protein